MKTATIQTHGETLFGNAQQAREVLQDHGFVPLCRLGDAEHWVHDGRRIILAYRGDRAADVPLDSADHVRFVRLRDGEIVANF